MDCHGQIINRKVHFLIEVYIWYFIYISLLSSGSSCQNGLYLSRLHNFAKRSRAFGRTSIKFYCALVLMKNVSHHHVSLESSFFLNTVKS